MKNRLLISLLTLYSVLFFTVLFISIPTELEININHNFGWILIVAMVGIVVFLIISQINPNKIDGKLISSKLTPLHKFIFPLTCFLAAVFFSSLYMLHLIILDLTPLLMLDSFCIIILLMSFYSSEPLARFCQLYLCEDKLVMYDYFDTIEVKYGDIVDLECLLFKSYRIDIMIDNKSKSFYFIPTVLVAILLFYTPPGIKKIKEIVKRNK